jgi:hypothetical protein
MSFCFYKRREKGVSFAKRCFFAGVVILWSLSKQEKATQVELLWPIPVGNEPRQDHLIKNPAYLKRLGFLNKTLFITKLLIIRD